MERDEASYYDQFHSTMSYSMSDTESGANFFFTEEPNKMGWKTTNNFPVHDTEVDDGGFEDHVVGKSYNAFESKLEKGFLDAPNLGLVAAPPAMFDYQPPLQRIDLKDNKIEVLPDCFFDELPWLSWCDLRYNRLRSIPHLTEEHTNLRVLLLQDNHLRSLPVSLARAVVLNTLGWTNNEISEPPRHILLQGCQATLDYLRSKLNDELACDEDEACRHDEQLRKDLEQTARKQTLKRTKSRQSITSGESGKSAELKKKEEEERKRRIDRLKYTWDLWKSIPYNGVSNHTLFEKSVQEVKDEVKAKLNQHREAVLQKIKDNEALGKWRYESRIMQMKGPKKPYSGVEMPFGTEADVESASQQRNPYGYEVVDASTFRSTMAQCMKRLQYLAENPTSINDTEKSLERLKEVEDIQRKLFDMKLKWSVKSSNLI